jgi:hypothetical protein
MVNFDLIDAFLNERKSEIEETTIHTIEANSDYLSVLLSNGDMRTTSPMKYQDKIDRFLSENVSGTFHIELKNMSEQMGNIMPSVNEIPLEERFFSETLAKIYIKQRKYDKALKIIRKLNLLNPEKNRYFADQIRFLEKLIINIHKIK